MGCIPNSVFSAVGHFDWPITHPKTKSETWKVPCGNNSYVRAECLPFCLGSIGEKGKALGKGYGIK
jgi:hypothetical protein